jgi:hypothetical protein
VTAFDPSVLGTDVALAMSDLQPVWGLASGLLNLGYALVRRLSCPPGGLFYDSDYGYDVTGLLNATLDQAGVAAAQQSISVEVEKDPRVKSCGVTLVFNQATGVLRIPLKVTLVTGQTFSLVIAANNVTVALIEVNDQAVGTLTVTVPAAQNVQLVVGPPGADGAPGPAGAQGPAGASGTPQFTSGEGVDEGSTSSGDEEIIWQELVDFDDLPVGNVTAKLTGLVFSTAGTSVFNLRVGGTLDNPLDGTVRGTFSTGSATPVVINTSSTFTNPTGKVLIKITGKSSINGETAALRVYNVTIR